MLPFLAVVRSPEANGVLTDAALRSLQAFLAERLIGRSFVCLVVRGTRFVDGGVSSYGSALVTLCDNFILMFLLHACQLPRALQDTKALCSIL